MKSSFSTPIYKTRRCHHCTRHSWAVADNNPCPWCGKRTGKYHNVISWIFVIGAMTSIVAMFWAVSITG